MKKTVISGLLFVAMLCNLFAQRNLVEFMPTTYDALFYFDLKAIGEAGNLSGLKDQLMKFDEVKTNDFLSSWISGKNKWGIDYTGTITASLYMGEEAPSVAITIFIPLSNSKAFAKNMKKRWTGKFKPIIVPIQNDKFNLIIEGEIATLWNNNMLIINVQEHSHDYFLENDFAREFTIRSFLEQIYTPNRSNLLQDTVFTQFWAHRSEAGMLYSAKVMKKFSAYYLSSQSDTNLTNTLSSLFNSYNIDEQFVGMNLDFQNGCIKGSYEFFNNQALNKWNKSAEKFDPALLQYGLPNATLAATFNLDKENLPVVEKYFSWLNSLEKSMTASDYSTLNSFLQLYEHLPNQAALTLGMDEMGIMNMSVVAPYQDKDFITKWLAELQQQHNNERKDRKHQFDSLRQRAMEKEAKEVTFPEEPEVITADELLEDGYSSSLQLVDDDYFYSYYSISYQPEMFLTHKRLLNSDLYTIYFQYEPEHGRDWGYTVEVDTLEEPVPEPERDWDYSVDTSIEEYENTPQYEPEYYLSSNENSADTSRRYYISCKDDGYILFSTSLAAIHDFDVSRTTDNALFDDMGDNINKPFHLQSVKLNTLQGLLDWQDVAELEEFVITTTPNGMSAALNLKNKSMNALEWILRQYIQMAKRYESVR